MFFLKLSRDVCGRRLGLCGLMPHQLRSLHKSGNKAGGGQHSHRHLFDASYYEDWEEGEEEYWSLESSEETSEGSTDIPDLDEHAKIVGGRDIVDERERIPWFAFLLTRVGRRGVERRCGGAVISATFILSAGEFSFGKQWSSIIINNKNSSSSNNNRTTTTETTAAATTTTIHLGRLRFYFSFTSSCAPIFLLFFCFMEPDFFVYFLEQGIRKEGKLKIVTTKRFLYLQILFLTNYCFIVLHIHNGLVKG